MGFRKEIFTQRAYDEGDVLSAIDCPLSKGNQAPQPKFERPNGKNTKSKIFLS